MPSRATCPALSLSSVLALLAAAALPSPVPGQQPDVRPSFYEPGISPDGSEIAFVHGGDIWSVPASGGQATLLVGHEAEEGRPLFSPDGSRLAFLSDREGSADVHLLDLESGRVRRLTFAAGDERLSGWSRDGSWIYFSSSEEDVGGMHDVFRVRPEGGTPAAVLADTYASEYYASPGPDGSVLALSTRGRMALPQWWRNGHAHIDEAEIWTARPGDTPSYRPLVQNEAKNVWPMWSGDGSSLYWVSDVSGSENIWTIPASGGEARRVTDFAEGRVLWPSLAPETGTIAFERDFGIWTVDPATGRASPVEITLRGASPAPGTEHRALTSDLDELALSPDGEKVAFVVRGEVFATSAEDGGYAERVTRTPAAELQAAWAPDSRRLVYVSRRDGEPSLFMYDFRSETEERLTDGSAEAYAPVFAPEGDELAYLRDGRELRILDTGSGEERTVAEGVLRATPWSVGGRITWSPDGRWVAYVDQAGAFSNARVAPADGSADPQRVSFLANGFSGSLQWSPDGTSLFFNTSQRTEDGRVARVDLVPRTPTFREDRFRELFVEEVPEEEGAGARREAAADASPGQEATAEETDEPGEVEFDGIRRRLELLPVGLDAGRVVLSPDGESLVVAARAEGQTNLYVYSIAPLADEPPVARQLTSSPGSKSSLQFSPDGSEIWYLHRGEISAVDVESGETRKLAVRADMEVDRDREKRAAFDQAWSALDDFFYDGDFHGADWRAVRDRFAPYAAGATTDGEFDRIVNLMVGELNASHLGIRRYGDEDEGAEPGRLGLRFDREALESEGRFLITGVVPLGPADVSGEIRAGDRLLAVNGRELDGSTNLNRVLLGTEGEKVELRVADDADGSDARTVAVQPMSAGAEGELVYRDWVEGRRAYVEERSDGRLGYVHLPDMGWGSLQQLYLDLDALQHRKEGVVVDVRNNNGGFVNVYAIDVLARRNYFTMTPRRGTPAPSRLRLGQRALGAPTALVTNYNTLSDGEDFTEGYRTLDLGPVVGEPTAGWIIYTSSVGLVDGSSLRMPYIEVRGADGEVMERNPREVDVPVERPAGESYSGRDAQLDAAVRELLERPEGR